MKSLLIALTLSFVSYVSHAAAWSKKLIIATILVAAASVYAARNFVASSGQFLGSTAMPLTTYPATFSAWLKPVNTASNHSLVYLGSTVDTRRLLLWVGDGSISLSNYARASAAQDGGGITYDAISTTRITNTAKWYHLAAVFASSTSRKIYVDGVLEDTKTNLLSTTSLNRYAIGARANQVPNWGAHTYGLIGEVGVWNVALADSEITQLALGANPQWIRRASLQSYVPLHTGLSPDVDMTGQRTMGLTNSPAQSTDHPPVFQ